MKQRKKAKPAKISLQWTIITLFSFMSFYFISNSVKIMININTEKQKQERLVVEIEKVQSAIEEEELRAKRIEDEEYFKTYIKGTRGVSEDGEQVFVIPKGGE